jgi:hypothetical protein
LPSCSILEVVANPEGDRRVQGSSWSECIADDLPKLDGKAHANKV